MRAVYPLGPSSKRSRELSAQRRRQHDGGSDARAGRDIGHGVSFSITHLSPGLNYGLRRCRVCEPVGDYGGQTCRAGRRRRTRPAG